MDVVPGRVIDDLDGPLGARAAYLARDGARLQPGSRVLVVAGLLWEILRGVGPCLRI